MLNSQSSWFFLPWRIKMGSENWNFDAEAASRHKNPGRVKGANDIAEATLDERILTSNRDILEFGCGTGLLTALLSPHVRSVTGVNSPRGMIDVLRGKLEIKSFSNIRAHFLDIEKLVFRIYNCSE
jgi:protein-L-isoaspartate O-methyltransferase